MDEDLFQVFIMFSILGSGILAAACLFLHTNSERFNLHPIISCLLCINVNKRKNSMHPHIRVAKPFELDPEEDMEKARRRLPMFDLNVNRKFHIFGHHTHHKKSHHKIAPHESIYSVSTRKMTWAGHFLPRDEKHLLSPTLSPPTEGASSPCSPSHFMHCDANITSSSSSSECHKSGRRRSMF